MCERHEVGFFILARAICSEGECQYNYTGTKQLHERCFSLRTGIVQQPLID